MMSGTPQRKRLLICLAGVGLLAIVLPLSLLAFKRDSLFERATPIVDRMPNLQSYSWLDSNHIILTEYEDTEPSNGKAIFSIIDLRSHRVKPLEGFNKLWKTVNLVGPQLRPNSCQFSPDGKWAIVYNSTNPPKRWILRLDGNKKSDLPASFSDLHFWSPDGSGLLYSADISDKQDFTSDFIAPRLMLFPFDQKQKPKVIANQTPFKSRRDGSTIWVTNDGCTKLTVIDQTINEFGVTGIQIDIYDLKTMKLLVSNPSVEHPLYTPPGSCSCIFSSSSDRILWTKRGGRNLIDELFALILHSKPADHLEIGISDSYSKSFKSLGDISDGLYPIRSLVFSPDGKRISFLKNGVIYVAPVE